MKMYLVNLEAMVCARRVLGLGTRLIAALAPEVHMQTLQLNTRLSKRSWLGDEDSDEEDPFAEVGLIYGHGDTT